MRRLYSLAAYALAPAYCAALLWRGLRERGYWQRFGERLGLGPGLGPGPSPEPGHILIDRGEPDRGSLWVHAASAGEVQAAAPLVLALRRRVPDARLVLTTSTPAGAARARALLTRERVDVRYVPLDLPGCVRRFLRRVQPRLALILETELWPNLYHECGRRGVPLVLASARISERSTRRYGMLRGVFGRALAQCALIAAQTEADAGRFRTLGAKPLATRVVGNIKFDFELPGGTLARGRALRERHASGRPVWVAGSTHHGEEQAALEAHEIARKAHAGVLLVIAPRHPPRFAEVGAWLEARGVRLARRSRDETCNAETEVLLLDTLGELLDFYAAADVVFVGGSLVPVGGHNLLEPAALGRAILTGPHQSSAGDIARLLAERGALQIVHDARELGESVARLLASAEARARMGGRASAVVDENRGALERLLSLIDPLLEPAPPRR